MADICHANESSFAKISYKRPELWLIFVAQINFFVGTSCRPELWRIFVVLVVLVVPGLWLAKYVFL